MNNFEQLVNNERAYQDSKWQVTDPVNTIYHWGAYITAYTSRSLTGVPGESPERIAAFKKDMIKVAALAKAAWEKL